MDGHEVPTATIPHLSKARRGYLESPSATTHKNRKAQIENPYGWTVSTRPPDRGEEMLTKGETTNHIEIVVSLGMDF